MRSAQAMWGGWLQNRGPMTGEAKRSEEPKTITAAELREEYRRWNGSILLRAANALDDKDARIAGLEKDAVHARASIVELEQRLEAELKQ